MLRTVRWAAAVAVLGLFSCAQRRAAQQISGAQNRIRSIEIEGNRHLSDDQILPHLNLKETTWLPLPDRQYLYPGFLPVDADRIESLYAAHGHYDAIVVDMQVKEHERRDIVDIRYVVDEGEPTLVSSVNFEWPHNVPSDAQNKNLQPKKIQTHCGLSPSEPFDVEEMHMSEATMQEALRNRGYAFATVQSEAKVDRINHVAEVTFTLRPGPLVTIGNIKIEGLQSIPESLVRVEIENFPGKRFSPARIRRMEDAIFALNIFRSVVIQTAEQPRNGAVDITITVQESRPQLVKLGVGLGLEPNRWEQHGEVRYRHENLFHNLTRFDVRLRVGYAELPWLFNPREHGPFLLLKPTLTKKGFLEKKLIWTLGPSFELGIQEGYQFHATENRVGLSRFFTRFVETGVTHNVRYVDFFNLSETLDTNRSLLGLDFRDPYLLSYIQFQVRFHLTDQLLNPNNGAVIGSTYDLAGGIFGGQYDYHKVVPEIRGYWTPLRNRLQLAARARTSLIFPFGDEPGAPFDLKLYLGGTNTIRGWGLRRLAPDVSLCDSDGCTRVPVGGQTSILGNFESRVRVWKGLWFVGFVDMGDVQADVATYRPSQWNYSAGPGIRYNSPIGTFRIDAGFRLNDPPEYSHQPRWALHFGLGESF